MRGFTLLCHHFLGHLRPATPLPCHHAIPPHDDVVYMQDNCKYVLDTKEGILGPLKTGVTIIENSPY